MSRIRLTPETWIAMEALRFGLPVEVFRNMTFRQYEAALRRLQWAIN